MTRGGPRPRAGRPRRPDPGSAEEAARELARYVGGDGVWTSWPECVCIDLPEAIALLHKLRRRKPRTTPKESP